jgi:serine O-acetyltransferase
LQPIIPYRSQQQLPSFQQVEQFTQDLLHHLFPVDSERPIANIFQLKAQLKALLVAGDAPKIVDAFFADVPEKMGQLLLDARFMQDNDPAAKSLDEVLLAYPGFKAIAVYRLANLLYQLMVPIIPRIMSEWAHHRTGIDIHAGAFIGCPFMIDHGTGVVIGETTIIGQQVKIFQGVTLGALAVRKEEQAVKRHPTIEDNVVIYAGSTILGGNTIIGNDSIIGGNTWITQSVPAFSIVYHQHQTMVKDRREVQDVVNFVI